MAARRARATREERLTKTRFRSKLRLTNRPESPFTEVARRLKAERDAHKLAFENDQLRREAERLQKLLNAMHQIAGELARPSGI